MKILQINNFHYRRGGSEAVYFNTANLLQRFGHEVIFFSSNNSENVPCDQSKYFISNIRDIPKWKGVLNYFYNLEAKLKLEKLILEEKPDIAHVHLFWGNISPSIFSVLRKHKIPLIHTAHDYRMVCPAYTFTDVNGNVCEKCLGKNFFYCATEQCSKGNRLESFIMATEMYFRNVIFDPAKNLAGVIFVSNFSKLKHMQYNTCFSDMPNIVLHNFMTKPDGYFLARDKRNYFLYFGRLSHEKGLHTLIDTFKQLPALTLKIVGTGPDAELLAGYVQSKGIRNIEFLGYKKGHELNKIVAEASFVIVPSEWYENNPMTIIEAYSMGVPVIGASIGGISEMLPDNETGFLFTSKDAGNLKAVVLRANQLNEEEYKALSNNALRFAANNFAEESYYRQLIAFYNEILSIKKTNKN